MEPGTIDNDLPSADNHLSWFRTRLAVERTLMAWLRVAIALIGFGFALVQYFERMKQQFGTEDARYPNAPRTFALVLILLGLLALVAGLFEYRWTVRHFRSGGYAPIAGLGRNLLMSPLFAVSVAVGVIGVFAFIAVFFRLV